MTKIKTLTSIHSFLHATEALKRLLRHSWLSDGRRESVAEHTWRACLMAMVLKDETGIVVDVGRVVQMLTVHDLAEIKAGDYHAFKKIPKDKHEREQRALDELLRPLSEKSRRYINGLWHEFEDSKTPEAKFAQAMDKLEVLIQHNEAGSKTWEEKEYDFNCYYSDDKVAYNETLTLFRGLILEETLAEIDKETTK